MAANGLATNNALFPKLDIQRLGDFAAVARIGYAPLVDVVHPSFQAKSLKRTHRPGEGRTRETHLRLGRQRQLGTPGGRAVQDRGKIDVLHVPYKGGAPAMADLLGERISFMPINPIEALRTSVAAAARARGGKRQARALLPDVPTVGEAGVPGFEASVWWGLVAPAKTPRESSPG